MGDLGKEVNTQTIAGGETYRLSGRDALDESIRRMRNRLKNLEKLSACLPRELPQEADEALWEMIVSSR